MVLGMIDIGWFNGYVYFLVVFLIFFYFFLVVIIGGEQGCYIFYWIVSFQISCLVGNVSVGSGMGFVKIIGGDCFIGQQKIMVLGKINIKYFLYFEGMMIDNFNYNNRDYCEVLRDFLMLIN